MNPTTQQQSDQLEQLVRETRRRLRRNAVWLGAALAVLAALVWLALAAALDMLFTLPTPLRMAAFVGLWLVLAGMVLAAVLWPAVRPMSLEQVAFRIERVLGAMHNRLVSVLDLRQRRTDAANASPFHARLVDQTAQRMADYDARQVAGDRTARRVTLLTVLVLLIMGGLTLGLHERVDNALLRLMQPTRPIPPVAWVKLAPTSGDLRVLQGDNTTVTAQVVRGNAAELSLVLMPDDGGEPIRYPMQADAHDPSRFSMTLNQVNQSYRYKVEGGGTWTWPHTITMVRRPIIEKVAAEVHLPAYMALPQPRPVDLGANQISAPLGSHVALTVQVLGDAASGTIHLYHAKVTQVTQKHDQETVWFDDDLPDDAQRQGNWTWQSGDTYSGSRAFTFDWTGKPFGFTTRLNPVTISDDHQSLFFYVRLDKTNAPGKLTLKVNWSYQKPVPPLKVPKGKKLTPAQLKKWKKRAARRPKFRTVETSSQFVWTSTSGGGGEGTSGGLPAPGQWVRLAVPLSDFPHDKKVKITQLTGLSFAIDHGHALLDRVGTFKTLTEQVQQTTRDPFKTLAMHREADGTWRGEIPVDGDCQYALSFHSPLGNDSAAMKPVPIIATTDQPPSVLVQRPGENITIDNPAAVPLVVRAFDDYGVANVKIEIADSSDGLKKAKAQTLAQYDQPLTNQMVTGAIDPRALKLKPGQAIYYRVLVSDRKGQTTPSAPARLALAAKADMKLAKDDGPLTGVLDGIGKLLAVQGKVTGDVAKLIGKLPAGLAVKADEHGHAELRHADGSKLSAEEIRKLVAQLQQQQADNLKALDKDLADQRSSLLTLADQFDAQAKQSQDSIQSLPLEPRALLAMADRARQMAAEQAAQPLDADVLKRLAQLQQRSPEQQKQYAQLQQQLQQLMKAQQQFAGNPQQTQQQLAAMLAQMQGRQQLGQLQSLNQFLGTQQQQLANLQQQLQALQSQTKNANAKELAKISAQQQQLDPETLKELEQVRKLLAQRMAKMQKQRLAEPPAPWVPPGKEIHTTPVEADTPEEHPKTQPAVDPKQELAKLKELIAQAKDKDWWDQPVNAPPPGATLTPEERYANRERPTEAGAKHLVPGGLTPRQMLAQHQDQMQQAMTANSNDLSAQQDQVGQLITQLQRAMLQASGQQAAGGASGEASGGMQQLMSSPAMQQANAMASLAGTMGMANPFGGNGQGMRTPTGKGGMVWDFMLDALPDNQTGHQAAIYNLPPSLRQPLIQGMSERGPDAYQPLIDAYYEQLSEKK